MIKYNLTKTNLIVISAIFIAIDIVFARFFTFTIPGFAKIDLQSIVAILCGYILGPLWACLTLIISDLVGSTLNAGSLGIFIGFTLSAALRGLLYGFLLNNKKSTSLGHQIICISFVYIFIDILLNNLWLSMLTESPYFPLLYGRLLPRAVLLILINVLGISCLKIISKNVILSK